MHAQQLDRRQRKTRKAIYDAFEALMRDAHYGTVTVAQIIERADVGRSTFYSHFETKDDLLDQMCRDMFDHIFEGVNEYCVTHPTLVTESIEGKLAHLLYHLRDTHSGVCGKLIREGEPHFTAYFESQLDVLFGKVGQGSLGVADSGGAQGRAEVQVAGAGKAAGRGAAGRGDVRSGAVTSDAVPAEFVRVLRVSSFSHAVSWWFENGATPSPERVAEWYVAEMGVAEPSPS